MKKLTTHTPLIFGWLLAVLLGTTATQAQDIIGAWRGELDVQVQKIPLVFHFQQEDGQWKGTMDSPSQGATGIPITEIALADSQLVLSIAAAGIRYEGRMADAGLIQGTFHQGAMQFPLDLQRGGAAADDTATAPQRPQEPKPPFPYVSEEVVFAGGESGVRLAGTLIVPEGEGPWPAAVLLAGSGPNDRDQHIFGHKTLLVIADHLARHGVATLRYDKRGVAASEGDYAVATSRDFADDARAAWDYLRQRAEIDPGRVGLIGHSEGGMLAPIVSAEQPDVAFLVLLAAPGILIDSLMALQNYLLGKSMGMDETQLAEAAAVNQQAYKLLRETTDADSLHARLDRLLRTHAINSGMPAAQIDPLVAGQVKQLASPWFRYFIHYDPQPALAAVNVPVLAINGDKDIQVTAKENLEGIAAALEKAGNVHVTVQSFPGLNHLLQPSETGAVSEYASIEQTIAPEVLQTLSKWLNQVLAR